MPSHEPWVVATAVELCGAVATALDDEDELVAEDVAALDGVDEVVVVVVVEVPLALCVAVALTPAMSPTVTAPAAAAVP